MKQYGCIENCLTNCQNHLRICQYIFWGRKDLHLSKKTLTYKLIRHKIKLWQSSDNLVYLVYKFYIKNNATNYRSIRNKFIQHLMNKILI